MSITIACNFFREPNTLPGFFECYSRWADDILMMSCPPSGAPPDEESIEIVKKWGGKLIHGNIDAGYGVVRTRLIQEAETDWVLISDSDERVHANLPVFECHGTGKYPEDSEENVKLSVGILEPAFSQVDMIRSLVKQAGPDIFAIRFVRRHWFNWALSRPCQNWVQHPDWQLRMMKREPFIGYASDVPMHEKARNFKTGRDPEFISGNTTHGPFYDHMHMAAKRMEPAQRAEDIKIFDAIHSGTQAQTWKELYGG